MTTAVDPAAGVLAAPLQPGDPMVPRPYRVERVTRELADTYTLVLAPEDPAATLRFAPGQFTMLYAPGAGEIPISISGDATHPEALVQTIRVVGAVSQALCKVRRGDTVGVRGPFGTHWPVDVAVGADVVVAAGGVGLPPLRPVMYHLLAHRERYGNIVLLYGARTPADLIFLRELEHWRGQLDLEVLVTVDRGTDRWRGHVGTVTTLIPHAEFDPAHTVAMICGPEIMMHFTVLELKKRTIADSQIYISMERNMQCAVGLCGHCQLGPWFICKDGPVFRFDAIAPWFRKREV